MKYPSLARVLSIVLVILSLALIGVGVAGIRNAQNDRESDIRKADLMEKRLGTYEEYKGILKNKKKYSVALEEYNELKDEYDSDHAEHKTDLAIHTATEGGIVSGKQQLWAAEGQLQGAYGQVDASKKDFDNHGNTYNQVMSQAREAARQQMGGYTYPEVKANYDKIVAGLAQFPEGLEDTLTAALNGQSEENVRLYLETVVSTIAKYEEVKAGYNSALEADNAAADAITVAESGITSANQTIANIDNALPGLQQTVSDKKAAYDAAQTADPPKTEDEMLQLKTEWDNAVAAVNSANEQKTAAQTALTTATEAKAQAEAAKVQTAKALSDISSAKSGMEAQMTSAALPIPLDKTSQQAQEELDQFNTLCSSVAQKKELEATKATLDATLPQLEAADNQIVAAATQAFNAKIDETYKTLNDAYSKIYAAGAEINYKEWKLPQEAEELLERKLDLDKRAEELAKMDAENQKLKTEEKKFTSARILLESNPQIKVSLEEGLEIEEATKNELSRSREELERLYKYRMIICSLLLSAAFFGIMGLFTGFEKIKSQFLRIAFVVLFILLTAGAEALSVYVGRGNMYSALTSSVIGLLCLPFIAPNAKKIKLIDPDLIAEDSVETPPIEM